MLQVILVAGVPRMLIQIPEINSSHLINLILVLEADPSLILNYFD
jgi:hypothetical protein